MQIPLSAVRAVAYVLAAVIFLTAPLPGQMVWASATAPDLNSQEGRPEGTQSNSTSISPQWTPFSSNDGLISNSVTAILAEESAIWFGTEAGISRFDGTWHTFRSGQELPPGKVSVLAHLGSTDTVWMGTDQGFLSRWDGQFWQPSGDLTSAVTALEMVDDQVWVGTTRGIFVLVSSGDEADQVAPTPIQSLLSLPDELVGSAITALGQTRDHLFVGTENGLWVHNGGWRQITSADGLPSSAITALWISPTGSVWAGTLGGVAFWHPVADVWTAYVTTDIDGNPLAISSLQGDSLGIVWAGSESGAYQFTEDGDSLQLPGDVGLTSSYVQAIAPDQDGYIWLGTVAGAFRYGRDLWTYERRNDVLPADDGTTTFYIGINHINDLLVDSRNALWVATDAGVRYKVADIDFGNEIYYTSGNSSLPADRVLSLAEDRDGEIWAGTSSGLARFRQNRWEQMIDVTDLPHPVIHDLINDDNGLWIGTGGGLVYYDLNSGQLEAQVFLAGDEVTALSLDGAGCVWAGTQAGDLFVAEEFGQFAPPVDVDQAFSGHIVSLAQDRENADGIWVSVDQQGVSHWDGQEWQNITTSEGLPSNVMYTLRTFPGDVSLWIGSEAGVTRYDGRSWSTFNVKDGDLSPSIQAVARNQIDGFWFGGRDGLTFYRPEHTDPWVSVVDVSGLTVLDQADDFSRIEVEQSDEGLRLQVAAGDLHTAQADITILYRWLSADTDSGWQATTERQLSLPIPTVGEYLLELTVRDKAFNEPDIKTYTIDVSPPPVTVNLPLIGPVRTQVFQAFAALTLMALLAFGYVSSEILQGRRRVRSALVRGYNPYISGEPVRRDDMFFGRDDLLQRILDTLHSNSIMIHGERRIGKTTLLYQLANRLRETDDADYWFLAAYVDLEGTTQDVFFHFLMEEIVSVVRTLPKMSADQKAVLGLLDYVDVRATTYTDRDFSRDMRTLMEILTEYSLAEKDGRQLRLILLMDEMDVMSHYDQLIQQQLRRIFMRDFSSTLGAVVAGIQISKAWDRVESPWFNLFNEIELKPFGREQAIELLTEPVREVYSYDQEALDAIIDHSDGRPFRLQQYGLESVNHMLAEGRRRVSLADVEVAHTRILEQINMNGPGQPDGEWIAPGRVAHRASHGDMNGAVEDRADEGEERSAGSPIDSPELAPEVQTNGDVVDMKVKTVDVPDPAMLDKPQTAQPAGPDSSALPHSSDRTGAADTGAAESSMGDTTK